MTNPDAGRAHAAVSGGGSWCGSWIAKFGNSVTFARGRRYVVVDGSGRTAFKE